MQQQRIDFQHQTAGSMGHHRDTRARWKNGHGLGLVMGSPTLPIHTPVAPTRSPCIQPKYVFGTEVLRRIYQARSNGIVLLEQNSFPADTGAGQHRIEVHGR